MSVMISINNISKEYRLGQIGSTTLRDELQRLSARLHQREDPTQKIGVPATTSGETFLALNNVSFSVTKGERVGIIGSNGAGKSTLLKLISRVTAPTSGWVGLNGRVASMLEVGTGFHQELTGRENIYMNGAILGMTRKEIDSKLENIIDFSECRQFIDTPVKRYSSGMYVKLAFSVAAHLDSEILIMDEVLAVGDVAFQEKCLNKMADISQNNGRTILYVSHNMKTIRELCTRCIVLKQGAVVYDGEVQQGIDTYMHTTFGRSATMMDVSKKRRLWGGVGVQLKLHTIQICEKETTLFSCNESIKIRLKMKATCIFEHVGIRLEIATTDGYYIGTTLTENIGDIAIGMSEALISFDIKHIVPGQYRTTMVLYQRDTYRHTIDLDIVQDAFVFEVIDDQNVLPLNWIPDKWGRVFLNRIDIDEIAHHVND